MIRPATEKLERKLAACFDELMRPGCLKKFSVLSALLASLTLAGGGCSSLRPSASVPEWEQTRTEFRPQTDTPSLAAQTTFWQLFYVLGGAASGY